MRRLLAVAAVGLVGTSVFAVGATTGAQYAPGPSTTIPESAVGTCVIEGVSPVLDENNPDRWVGVDVFLRCAETTERTSLHELHLVLDTQTMYLAFVLDQLEALPDDHPVTPQ